LPSRRQRKPSRRSCTSRERRECSAIPPRASLFNSTFNTVSRARTLDLYYIPTRYPNGIPGGLPYEAFDREEGEKALALATAVIDLVGKMFMG